MNINILHLSSFIPFIKEKNDTVVDQVYFFGVNVLELIYDINTSNIVTLKLNDDIVDYNDANKIEQLNTHLDKCEAENNEDKYNYEYKIHIDGIDAFTKEVEEYKADYFSIDDESYEIVYDKDTYEIRKILINGVETFIKNKDDLDAINHKIDTFRFKKWLKLEQNNN